ncbi:MAG TPA: glycosyltransferase family 2 protein [Clostridia bacterium]|nr:glycosyltransferase family 2 protein [Clostridia bacterium]
MDGASGWRTFEYVLNIIVMVFQFSLIPVFLYQLVIGMFGWVKRKDIPAERFKPVKSFAIIVAAHNEEMVIGNIVRNMRGLNYPEDLYDLFVIADNCDDNTAKVARENGAQVFERFNDKQRGKGFALEWMFEKLFKMEKKYDAVCVFDADNLVSSNYLMEMNKQLCKGHTVIQGYLDSKNPHDSLIAGSYSITYWINNRVFQLPRYYLGLSCAVGGTGFVVATEVLKEIGWGATCLTEDLEFTIKLVLKGKKVYWSHEAIVYDEKPLTLAQSWKQRKRWMQGQADCAVRYLKDLVTKVIRDRSWVAFDVVMYLVQPLIIVLNGVALVFNVLRMVLFMDMSKLFTPGTLITVLTFLFLTYFFLIFVALEGKVTPKIIAYFLFFPVYNLTWIPIIVQGFKNRNDRVWDHTKHTRSLEIDDLEQLEKV